MEKHGLLIVVPKKLLTAPQLKKLESKGHVVIECDEPEKVKYINIETPIETNDFFMSALFAMTCVNAITRQEHFVNSLYNRLKAKEKLII